jgi:hypothetical protein
MPPAVRLFDLALARSLLLLDGPSLVGWLEGNLPSLKARTRRGVMAWLKAVRSELPAELVGALPTVDALVAHWDDLGAALTEATTAAEVTLAAAAIAEKASFGEERVALPQACRLGAVFGEGGPPGALSSRSLFPTDGVERYVLLTAAQAETLLAAARELGEASERLAGLAALTGRCRAEAGLRLAYLHGD